MHFLYIIMFMDVDCIISMWFQNPAVDWVYVGSRRDSGLVARMEANRARLRDSGTGRRSGRGPAHSSASASSSPVGSQRIV
jgi:hypothetical protein